MVGGKSFFSWYGGSRDATSRIHLDPRSRDERGFTADPTGYKKTYGKNLSPTSIMRPHVLVGKGGRIT